MARTSVNSATGGSRRGFLGPFLLLSTLGTVLFALAIYHHDCVLSWVSPLPDIKTAFPFDDEVWTVAGQPAAAKGSDAVVPWKLQVSDADLDDLKDRLRKTRYATPMQGQNFEYGFPGDQLKKVVDYWLTKYDWRKQEELINKYDQFKTVIEGLNIHFVHIQPQKTGNSQETLKVLPIILLHGWPGSFFELYKLVPLLTKPQQISGNEYAAFEVIIPSLPGYGFSDAAQKPGLDPSHIARIFNKLMTRLKFEKYFVHGGDWGSAVGRSMAVMYPERISGVELTMYPIPMGVHVLKNVISLVTPSFFFKVDEPRKLILSNFVKIMRESGYMHIQGTKPDTVGAALLDSPAGLAAYIMEKFSTWTNQENIKKSNGGLLEYFTLDELLTNVMVYWVSNSIVTSQRLYKEGISGKSIANNGFPVLVPSYLSDFRNELPGGNPPNNFVSPYYQDLVNISKHETGGHFPAMEMPVELAQDIQALAKNVLLRNRK